VKVAVMGGFLDYFVIIEHPEGVSTCLVTLIGVSHFNVE
jgi:hypothetical protein